eukprot:TRINITY_DN2263_c0_g1_i1.p2 TRINITY_DN2263_c0_g1~~TRINITY_DN2263_c0_g1_i1.p2  ORF type:complete len:258 (-),score=59.62 TRINITY_DN2263_c0_g1_i1:33-806(-)
MGWANDALACNIHGTCVEEGLRSFCGGLRTVVQTCASEECRRSEACQRNTPTTTAASVDQVCFVNSEPSTCNGDRKCNANGACVSKNAVSKPSISVTGSLIGVHQTTATTTATGTLTPTNGQSLSTATTRSIVFMDNEKESGGGQVIVFAIVGGLVGLLLVTVVVFVLVRRLGGSGSSANNSEGSSQYSASQSSADNYTLPGQPANAYGLAPSSSSDYTAAPPPGTSYGQVGAVENYGAAPPYATSIGSPQYDKVTD